MIHDTCINCENKDFLSNEKWCTDCLYSVEAAISKEVFEDLADCVQRQKKTTEALKKTLKRHNWE